MTFKKCILTGVDLTPDVDSKAHVIPSALGGRLKPKGILSGDANETLNDKFDLPLIRVLHPIMALIGGVADRGEVQPTTMHTADGKEMQVVFGKPMRPGAHHYSSSVGENGAKTYNISARDRKEARTLLGRVKKEQPDLDIDALMENLTITETYVQGPLQANLECGPIWTFPAAFSMAAIYAAHCGIPPHPEFVSYVNSYEPPEPRTEQNLFPPPKSPLPPNTFFWMPSPSPFQLGESVTHALLLVADPNRAQALVYIELFNWVRVAVRVPYAGSELKVHSYGVDVITGQSIDVAFDVATILALPWEATHKIGDALLFQDMEARLGRLLGIAHARSEHHELGRVIQEALGPMDGRLITKEDIKRVAERVTMLAMAQGKFQKPSLPS